MVASVEVPLQIQELETQAVQAAVTVLTDLPRNRKGSKFFSVTGRFSLIRDHRDSKKFFR